MRCTSLYKTLTCGPKLFQGQAGKSCRQLARYSSENVPGSKDFDPIKRTGKILKDDLVRVKNQVAGFLGLQDPKSKLKNDLDIDDPHKYFSFQSHCDVLVIGGGVIGSAIAFFLLESFPGALNVTVLEKDPTYKHAATTLSCGGLRQQFSLRENILMSKYGASFMRELPQRCAVDGMDAPDVQFNHQGYLFLASEAGAEQLMANHALQLDCGARNKIFTAKQLKEKFPWLNTEDIAVGCLGLENEGWFDPWSLLTAFRSKAIDLGAHFIQGEAVGFEFMEMPDTIIMGHDGIYERLSKLIVRLENGETRTISFGNCVMACGSASGDLAETAKIGNGTGMLSFPLPVVPRKRFVYNVHCPNGPGLDLPFLIDNTGTYIRREGYGGHYICGRSPPEGEPEPTTADFEVDDDFFHNHVWPHLANRVPAMQELKVKSSWAGHYDYNTFDQNGILGFHPYYQNLLFATGFSGHGLQQAPAVGRAIMEMITDGGYSTIDLSRFAFDRILLGEKVLEQNIV